jgi:hypothetical protein
MLLYFLSRELNMLSAILHRQRKAAKEAAEAARQGAKTGLEAVEATRRLYGVRLLIAGLLWISIFLIARGLLAMEIASPLIRAAIAVAPVPFFIWYLVVWMKGVSQMDELERRIELEALGFAFPAALVLLMTLGLLDVAITLNPDDFSLRHVWAMLPLLYYIGLWRARARYQ